MKLRLNVASCLAAITLSSIALNASAERVNDITYIYYSDASHSTEVGRAEYFCGSGSYTDGEVTQYSTAFTVKCSLSAPAPPAEPTTYTNCFFEPDPYPLWKCS